jgi:DNA-binding response OmpR family regulator
LPNDQILLDVKMPGFNGLQVLASLRLAGWVNPIILLTAMRDDVADQALRLGATGLIHKPFDPEEVTNLVARIGQFSEAPPSIPRIGDLAGHLGHLCV